MGDSVLAPFPVEVLIENIFVGFADFVSLMKEMVFNGLEFGIFSFESQVE